MTQTGDGPQTRINCKAGCTRGGPWLAYCNPHRGTTILCGVHGNYDDVEVHRTSLPQISRAPSRALLDGGPYMSTCRGPIYPLKCTMYLPRHATHCTRCASFSTPHSTGMNSEPMAGTHHDSHAPALAPLTPPEIRKPPMVPLSTLSRPKRSNISFAFQLDMDDSTKTH